MGALRANEMDQLQFLHATSKHAETFIALQERSIDVKLYGSVGGLEEALREITENILYLLRFHDELVGSAAYRVRPGGSVYISNVVVDRKHRRRGFARAALSYILEMNKHAPRFDLVTHPENEHALRLYLSLGFEVESRRENFFRDGEPRLVLARSR
jgi:ribosomal protein S18 acetylase RimI-like enzyme